MAYDLNNGSGAMYHRLTLEGREKLTVGGVEDVERFDETCIVMSTCAGTLVVTGEGLHIGKLSLDGGELHVDGRIDGVNYEEEQPAGRGLLSRLFAGWKTMSRRSWDSWARRWHWGQRAALCTTCCEPQGSSTGTTAG